MYIPISQGFKAPRWLCLLQFLYVGSAWASTVWDSPRLWDCSSSKINLPKFHVCLNFAVPPSSLAPQLRMVFSHWLSSTSQQKSSFSFVLFSQRSSFTLCRSTRCHWASLYSMKVHVTPTHQIVLISVSYRIMIFWDGKVGDMVLLGLEK